MQRCVHFDIGRGVSSWQQDAETSKSDSDGDNRLSVAAMAIDFALFLW